MADCFHFPRSAFSRRCRVACARNMATATMTCATTSRPSGFMRFPFTPAIGCCGRRWAAGRFHRRPSCIVDCPSACSARPTRPITTASFKAAVRSMRIVSPAFRSIARQFGLWRNADRQPAVAQPRCLRLGRRSQHRRTVPVPLQPIRFARHLPVRQLRPQQRPRTSFHLLRDVSDEKDSHHGARKLSAGHTVLQRLQPSELCPAQQSGRHSGETGNSNRLWRADKHHFAAHWFAWRRPRRR